MRWTEESVCTAASCVRKVLERALPKVRTKEKLKMPHKSCAKTSLIDLVYREEKTRIEGNGESRFEKTREMRASDSQYNSTTREPRSSEQPMIFNTNNCKCLVVEAENIRTVERVDVFD